MNALKAEDMAVIESVFKDNPKEGEIYVHGYMDLFYKINQLHSQFPNDAEFGAAVRKLFNNG